MRTVNNKRTWYESIFDKLSLAFTYPAPVSDKAKKILSSNSNAGDIIVKAIIDSRKSKSEKTYQSSSFNDEEDISITIGNKGYNLIQA